MTNYITSVGVQYGTITIGNAQTSNTATITAVGTGAHIIFLGETATGSNVGTRIWARLDLTNTTTVTATRQAQNNSDSITVSFLVIDGDTTNLIQSVQSGTTTLTAAQTSNTSSISAVTNNNTAIFFLGFTTQSSSANLPINEHWCSLSGTTVTVAKRSASAISIGSWIVVEYKSAVLNSATQNVAYNATLNAASATSTISSVTTANTFMAWGGGGGNNNTSPSVGRPRIDLTNSTTVTHSWNAASSIARNSNCVVIEFAAGILNQSVQRGTIAVAAATSNTATITSANTTSSFISFLNNSSTEIAVSMDKIYARLTLTNATTVTANVNTAASPTASYEVVTYPPLSSADITFDAASNSGYQAATSSYTWSHTCTGSNRALVVGIGMLSLAQTVTSITYNGISMDFLGAKNSVTGAARVELWGMVAPSTGTNTIAVTLSGSIASAGGATSYAGVNQSSAFEALNSAQATNVGAADATVNVTTVADNDWVIDMVATDDTAITVGAGNTSRANVTGAGGSAAMGDTNAAKTPAGSVTMSWTNIGALSTWSIIAIAIRPLSAANLASKVFRKTLSSIGTKIGVRQVMGW